MGEGQLITLFSQPVLYVFSKDEYILEHLVSFAKIHEMSINIYRQRKFFFERFHPSSHSCIIADLRSGVSCWISKALLYLNRRNLPIIVLGDPDNALLMKKVFEEGAFDYITEVKKFHLLEEKIKQALNLSYRRFMSDEYIINMPCNLTQLTRREREVFDLLALGHTNKVIANMLTISAKTVEAHRAKVKEKTGATTLAEMIEIKHRIALKCKKNQCCDNPIKYPTYNHLGMTESLCGRSERDHL